MFDRGGDLPVDRIPEDVHIQQIVSNNGAFAAIDEKGKVYAWGNVDAGGDLPPGRIPEGAKIQQIVSNDAAFAAIDEHGKIYAWGHANWGGNLPPDRIPEGVHIQQIVSNYGAFAAIDEHGKVYAWGSNIPADFNSGATRVSRCRFRDLLSQPNQVPREPKSRCIIS